MKYFINSIHIKEIDADDDKNQIKKDSNKLRLMNFKCSNQENF